MKLNNEIVKEEVSKYNYTLVGHYTPKNKMRIKCNNCGYKEDIWFHRLKDKSKCSKCKQKEYSQKIKKEIESQGYILHNEYENLETVLILTCPKSHERKCKLNSFRRYKCEKCVNEEKLKNLIVSIKELGYVIISAPKNARGVLEATCCNGHFRKAKIHNFLNHDCPKCNIHRNYNYTYKDAVEIFNKRGFLLLTKEYINCKQSLEYICTCKRIKRTTMDTMINSDKYCCDECKYEYISEQIRGENHHNWKGGCTPIKSYIRNNLNDWKKKSIFASNYRCIVTKGKFDDIHHVKSFNKIFDKICKSVSYELNKDVQDYTTLQLKEILEFSEIYHNEMGLGICLSKEIHNHFHNLYGNGDNDSFQFLSFIDQFYTDSYNKVEEYILTYCK